VDKSRPIFEKRLTEEAESLQLTLPIAVKRIVMAAMSERDETAEICRIGNGNPEPETDLRDYESVSLSEDIHAYFKREVSVHVPDAWIDESKTKIGYEIPFNRHFYKYTPPRPLDTIQNEIKQIEQEIVQLLGGAAG